MATNTLAFFPKCTRKEIRNILKAFDRKLYTKQSKIYHVSESLYFHYKGEERIMHTSNIPHGATQYGGLPDNTKGVWAEFGAWGRGIEIFKMLCYVLSGYVLESDVGHIPFRRVNKDPRKFMVAIWSK